MFTMNGIPSSARIVLNGSGMSESQKNAINESYIQWINSERNEEMRKGYKPISINIEWR